MSTVILLALLGPCTGGNEEFPSLGFYLFPQSASSKLDRPARPPEVDEITHWNNRNEEQAREAAEKARRLAQYKQMRQARAQQEAIARKARIQRRQYYAN